MNTTHLSVLQTYCVKCHNADRQKGKFRVDTLPLVIHDSPGAEKSQKVLNALNAGEMPPEDAKQLEATEKADLVDNLAQAMVDLRKRMADRHGKITMIRLNAPVHY